MRETRPSGSVRGVRSDPYPYRDPTSSGAKHRVLTTRHTQEPACPKGGVLAEPATRVETAS